MIYADQGIKDIQIAYIGGGSRNFAWVLMRDLCKESRLSGTVRLYDLDHAAARANEIIGNRFNAHPDCMSDWTYRAVPSLPAALTGADFVVISILPGTFDEMASDVHTPEKYGIYQSVGDTVGPAGVLRAMRAVPMYEEIARAIQTCSPQAWVISYTNPMTVCTRTLYAVFPEIKAMGCCHEVFGAQAILAGRVLKEMAGISSVKRQEIMLNVLGINHFTWVDQATYRGMDLMPLYRQFAARHHAAGHALDGNPDAWKKGTGSSALRIKFDLTQKFGLYPAAGDRHLAEFLPATWYLKDPATIAAWKFHLTPVSERQDGENKLREKAQRLVSGEEPVVIKESGEEGVKILTALLGLNEMVTNVNLPNRGQITGLPLDAVVETNAVFRRDAIRPVMAGRLPDPINNLVIRHVYNQETIVRAGLARDQALAFQAFLNDPLLSGLAPDQAQTLFAEMAANTRKYLPDWK